MTKTKTVTKTYNSSCQSLEPVGRAQRALKENGGLLINKDGKELTIISVERIEIDRYEKNNWGGQSKVGTVLEFDVTYSYTV